MSKEWLQQRQVQSAPLAVGGRTIVLESRAVILRWPFGGGIWGRPTAVLVTADGQTSRIPITDVTRQALWSVAGFGIAAGLISILYSYRKKGSDK